MGASLPLLGGLLARISSSKILNKHDTLYSGGCYNHEMLNLTYEYKLIPTDAQRETFDHWLEICRKVYKQRLLQCGSGVTVSLDSKNGCALLCFRN